MYNPAKLIYGDGENVHIEENVNYRDLSQLFQRNNVLLELVGYFPLNKFYLMKLPREAPARESNGSAIRAPGLGRL